MVMDRKFYIAVLVIGLIALTSVAEGNPAARYSTVVFFPEYSYTYLRHVSTG